MRHQKITEVLVSYFSRADDYTVVMETLGMKYGTKKIQGRATEIVVNHLVHRFKFQYCYWLKLIVFFISQFYAWRNKIVPRNKLQIHEFFTLQ